MQGEDAFGDAETGAFLGFHGHLDGRGKLVVVGMDPTQFVVEGEHVVLDLLGDGGGLLIVVAIDIDLHGGGDGLVIHLAEAHMGLGEVIGVMVVHLLEQVLGGLFGGGVDDELCEVLRRDAWRVGHMETGCGLADERGDGGDPGIGEHHVLQGVGDAGGGFETAAFGETDLDGEDVAFGVRHHLHVEGEEHEDAEGDGDQAHADGEVRVLEAVVLHLVVEALQPFEEPHLRLQEAVVSRPFGLRLDEQDLQRGDDEHGVGQGGHQGEGDGPGEILHEVTQRPGDDSGHGEEHGGDGCRGDEHGHE